ncbi:sulfatase-like hydrolase/transferase [Cohnella sp. CFH 77786]|uniref:LTA synthase family protein n=1 Tax=Cohnella sp. CFH 77786 TaxID=2662265 RepID=UPI001C60CD3C|nr:LTA synthase family protein [Cohnella sp. CFH 77786]MBW5447489.1 sulfatase-like hydrolase/transferase [Cohnella sp. CFH 77786]
MWKHYGARWFAKPFVFFSLIMLLKIYLTKAVLFSDGSIWLPLITELPAVWVVFCLVEWLAPRRKFGAYLVANLIMTCVYFAVIMYYKYFGVVVTYHALQQVGQVTEVQGSVMSLLHPYFLLIYTDIVVFLLLLAVSRRFRQWRMRLARREPRRIVLSLFILSLTICLANVWQSRESMNELKKSENMGIIPYQTVEIATGAKDAFAAMVEEPEPPNDVTPPAIASLKGIVEPAAPQYQGIAKGKNLIVIQLEAFQNFLLGTKIDGVEVTPNLNGLLGSSIYFPRFYQMVGQGNTADAEFVVNTSLYVPQHGAASQDFGDRLLPSMPRVLAANGYDTATFHTNDVKFWNRKALYRALGFGRYYDKTFFGDDDMVFFGSSDELLYAKTAGKLSEMSAGGKPFYAQLISMSGHHPFNIPERKIRFKLPDRFEGTLVGDYLEAQNYADYALGQFFAKLKQDGLWDNSVIVIYGDHMGLPIYSLSERERELMKELIGHEYRSTEMMNIPLILSVPGIAGAQVRTETGGQADIYPTVANLLGISLKDRIHFGQDLLNQTSNLLPQRYYLPSGSFINDKGIFVPGESFADGTLFGFGGTSPAPEEATREQYERALKLLDMSDRYVQSLPKLD